jgi:hypothetical protein
MADAGMHGRIYRGAARHLQQHAIVGKRSPEITMPHRSRLMSNYRNCQIEYTIIPDSAGQYEAAFSIKELQSEWRLLPAGGSFDFPPVGSYLTPDDAREQTEAWARRWIDANLD